MMPSGRPLFDGKDVVVAVAGFVAAVVVKVGVPAVTGTRAAVVRVVLGIEVASVAMKMTPIRCDVFLCKPKVFVFSMMVLA